MPRYEFSDGRSHKFWEITVEGDGYTVQYGRIGTVGQTSSKSFKDAATAQKKAEAAIRSKTKKGYQLVSAAEQAEEQDALAARLVLADQLQEAGDPRGRLIELMAEKTKRSGKERDAVTREINKILEANAQALLGALDSDEARACTSYEWKLGYWERLSIWSDYDHEDFDTSELLGELLAHPSAVHLEQLMLGIPHSVWDGESNWQPLIDQVAKHGAPELTHLHLADDEDNAEISWCQIGSLAKVWAVAPKLEDVRIQGVGIAFGDVVAPELRKLRLESGGLPGEPVRALSAATLPKLQHLEIWFGTEDYGASGTIEDCAGILEGKGLPAVEWLGLMNGTFMDDIARALPNAPILKQVKTLSLSMGTMTDEGGKAILDHADAFRHLQLLDLSENFLSDDICRRLGRALPNVRTYGQKDAYEYGDDEPWYYTSVSE